jgi:hypothetical protein
MKIINNRWVQLLAFLLILSPATGGDISGLEVPVLIVILVITVPAIRRRVGLDRLDSLLKQKQKTGTTAPPKPHAGVEADTSNTVNDTSAVRGAVTILSCLDDSSPEPFTDDEAWAVEKGIAFAPDGIGESIDVKHFIWNSGYVLRLARGTWLEIYLSETYRTSVDESDLKKYFQSGSAPAGVTAVLLTEYKEFGQITCYVTPSHELPSTLQELTDYVESCHLNNKPTNGVQGASSDTVGFDGNVRGLILNKLEAALNRFAEAPPREAYSQGDCHFTWQILLRDAQGESLTSAIGDDFAVHCDVGLLEYVIMGSGRMADVFVDVRDRSEQFLRESEEPILEAAPNNISSSKSGFHIYVCEVVDGGADVHRYYREHFMFDEL